MKGRNRGGALSRVVRISIILSAFCSLLPLRAFAQPAPACTPVAYLFRHAEETGAVPANINSNTLKPAGKEHAQLYGDMITSFEDSHGYCPVSRVFAMARKNAPDAGQFANGLGTTNPFFTGKPFANVAEALLECANYRIFCSIYLANLGDTESPITSTNPGIVEVPGRVQPDGLLYEYLTNKATRDDLRELVKDAIQSDHSVAIFWSSQGMGEIAKVLGSPIPGYAKNHVPAQDGDYKAPRNSVFVFTNYNPNAPAETGAMVPGKFQAISATGKLASTTGQYIQCFNYAPGKGFDAAFPGKHKIAFYCKFNEDLSSYGLSDEQLTLFNSAICDVNKLTTFPGGSSSVYIGYGVGDNNQCF